MDYKWLLLAKCVETDFAGKWINAHNDNRNKISII